MRRINHFLSASIWDHLTKKASSKKLYITSIKKSDLEAKELKKNL